MKRKLGIIGIGSAGIISAGHSLSYLDNSWEITTIYDPNKNILGIGESTNANFCGLLEKSIDFSITSDLDSLDATYKFGTKFINWRDHDWINPLIEGSLAIHFNTNKLKDFALPRFQEKWGEKYKVIEGEVFSIRETNNSVIVNVDNIDHEFEYIIDCRGFPKDFSEDYIISECSLINHGIIHDSQVLNPVQATEHTATKNGWMFGVPLQSRTSYGYLYNDIITTKDQALEDFSEILNIPVTDLTFREYSFNPYYAKQVLTGRVLKNGNQAFFFEPISATSIYMYIEICKAFCSFLLGKYNSLDVNQSVRNDIEDLEVVINYYYHGGSMYDTDFWRQSKSRANKFLESSCKFYWLTEQLNLNKNKGNMYEFEGLIFPAVAWYNMDKYFNYNYFTGNENFKFNINKVMEQKMEQQLRNTQEIQTLYRSFEENTQQEFNDVGYVHLKNVVSKPVSELITHYALHDQMQEFRPELEGQQIPGTHSIYADPLMEALLKMLHPVMEKATGLTLHPTYSYYRVYKPGDVLKPHTDRESCEISTTVCFNFDYKELNGKYDWPIWMIDKAVVMEPGDMVIYHGCDLVHWRDAFEAPEGSWHVQAFLHYVDANGPFASFKYDNRECIGSRPKELGSTNTITKSNKSYITYTG